MADSNEKTDVSEAQIASHWKEEEFIFPATGFVGQANMADPTVLDRFSTDNFPECYREYADLLDWDQYWHTTLDSSNPPFFNWFVGGKLNASYNCVDRHLEKNGNKVAFTWVSEIEEEPDRVISYRELWVMVNEFAALLKDFAGLKTGDRVTLHMPMVPELPVTMLALARLGVTHSQVFGGFSGPACGDRIVDSESHILITSDAYYRSGTLLDHKIKADEAVEQAKAGGVEVDKVLVWQRYPGKISSPTEMKDGRDFYINELINKYRGQRIDPVSLPADHPLFLMYTSGTTAKPKGCQHSTGGYMAYVTGTTKYYQDIHPEDVYWCMADIGWITGHSYIVYGPLSVGASSVLFEGVPNYPDAGRPWRIAQRLGVNIFHTAPTTIRMLRKAGPEEPAKYDYEFKHMTTVGEPIEPEVWRWYYDVVGKGKAAVVDTYWQTETGGFIGTTLPALQPMKPGSCGPGALGIVPVILDDDGNKIEPGSGKAGNVCMSNPWPGRMQTIYGDPDRFVETYYGKYAKHDSKNWEDWPYVTGDGGTQGADGYIRVVGRVDDVINVAGHRLGTKELESAALTVTEIGEAAAVPAFDELKGRVPELYVSLKPGVDSSNIESLVKKAISTIIGPIARPSEVWITSDLPKTRSGKIMRRVIASISNFVDVGDVTTLANPEVVEEIREHVQAAKLKAGKIPEDLPEAMKKEIEQFGEN
ncbi:MAG: acetate--CoA ligase [Chloroflexota bacterium]|nr:acetate--CoA ligase [Chloroflexota bacterium]